MQSQDHVHAPPLRHHRYLQQTLAMQGCCRRQLSERGGSTPEGCTRNNKNLKLPLTSLCTSRLTAPIWSRSCTPKCLEKPVRIRKEAPRRLAGWGTSAHQTWAPGPMVNARELWEGGDATVALSGPTSTRSLVSSGTHCIGWQEEETEMDPTCTMPFPRQESSGPAVS